MKKKHIILLSLVIIIGTATYFFWDDLVMMYEIGKIFIFDEPISEEIIMEDHNSIFTDEPVVTDIPEESSNETEQQPEQTPEQNPVESNKESPGQSESIEKQIIEKYRAQSIALKNESLGQIKALAVQAANEYKNLPEKNKSSAALQLAKQYMSKGKTIEAQCDEKFNAIIANMKAELKRNNLPTTAAEEALKQYEAEKSAQRAQLLKEAFNHLKT